MSVGGIEAKEIQILALFIVRSVCLSVFCFSVLCLQMGYARLQLLLAYVIPEMLDEDWLSEEDAAKSAQGDTDQQPPLHVPYRPYGKACSWASYFSRHS